MQAQKIYDIIGIGIGPFNLGLAALATDISELETLFVDQQPAFNWHPGLLIPGARMQVPYYADLVTLANPQSRFGYFCYLKARARTYSFGVQENPFPLRREYNDYCQWVAGQLPNLLFGHHCEQVTYDPAARLYQVHVYNQRQGTSHAFRALHLVIGTGTAPFVPECARSVTHPLLFHSSEYLNRKTDLLENPDITIIGSGQSAAEIFYDLLQHAPALQALNWYTRSAGFQPMDYSKFALEMTSPEYIDYFYQLAPDIKRQLLGQQSLLYKGINQELVTRIHELLYQQRIEHGHTRAALHPSCELRDMAKVESTGELTLQFRHTMTGHRFNQTTHAVILATGYGYTAPDCLWPLTGQIYWAPDGGYQVSRNYSIDKHQRIFVQNADLQTHGFNAADLGMGPYRNSVILNDILGREHFKLERGSGFQTFGAPV